MVFPDRIDDIDLDVPSGKLRTSKKCAYWMYDGDTLKITIHFDLSQSIVQTGENEYKIKPVFHPFNTTLEQPAKICGRIDAGSFGNPPQMVVNVIYNGPEAAETYTEVTVPKNDEAGDSDDPTGFCIWWVVPIDAYSESYTVEIFKDDSLYYTEDSDELTNLGPGGIWDLNSGDPI